MLATGNNSYPNQVCVIIKGKGLEQPNLVKAVDICYNSFLQFGHLLPMTVPFLMGIYQKVLVSIEEKAKG
mgnify:CR=1 FL=1